MADSLTNSASAMRPHRRRRRERLARQYGPAELDQHPLLARRAGGRGTERLGRDVAPRARVVQHEPRAADEDLVAVGSMRGAKMRSPLTLVPFVDPRSVMHHAGPTCSSRACTRETAGSSSMTRSFWALLPIESRPRASSSSTRSCPFGPNRSSVATGPSPRRDRRPAARGPVHPDTSTLSRAPPNGSRAAIGRPA